jgi:branched-subunit amino acid aminotransferase/4-amino-4-deoxychorismate lyase
MAELSGNPVSVDQLQTLALVNYGHFTSLRVEPDGGVRGLALHLERLSRDCRALFDTELDLDEVRHLIRRAVGDSPVVVRVTVFDPDLALAHPGSEAKPRILVTSRSAVPQPQPPMRVRSAHYERDLPLIKHVGLLGQLYQRRRAQVASFDDVVFVDRQGCISEGGTWNIGFFDGERVVWPQAEYLPGVTAALLDKAHNGPIATGPVTVADLPSMEAAFATNAAIGVRAIQAIDDHTWPTDHPILDTLRSEYADTPTDPLLRAT